jgi:hypothetical protein
MHFLVFIISLGIIKSLLTCVASSSSLCQEECLADEIKSTSLICSAVYRMQMLPVLQHGS